MDDLLERRFEDIERVRLVTGQANVLTEGPVDTALGEHLVVADYHGIAVVCENRHSVIFGSGQSAVRSGPAFMTAAPKKPAHRDVDIVIE